MPRNIQGLKMIHLFPDQQGKCACRCGQPLPPRRRRWATKDCEAKAVRHLLILKGDSDAVRKAVFERDKGVCARCGIDCPKISRACVQRWAYNCTREQIQAADDLRLKYMRLGYPHPTNSGKSWWNADHVEPVAEGGRNSLSNFQTLCVVCHKRKTAEQAARKALTRRRK